TWTPAWLVLPAAPLPKTEADSGADVNGPASSFRGARSASRNDERWQSHLTPVPLQRWHFTTLSPFLTKPLPSQFLHFCFFLMFGPLSLAMLVPSAVERIV